MSRDTDLTVLLAVEKRGTISGGHRCEWGVFIYNIVKSLVITI